MMQTSNIREIFDTNVVIVHCTNSEFYSQSHIVDNLIRFVRQFNGKIVEQTGEAKSSCGSPRGQIAHFIYLQPLMNWIRKTVWDNRQYLKGGKDAVDIDLGANWINEMYEGCSGKEHVHRNPVAVFYVRVPESGADMIFKDDNGASVPAGVIEGDLLIHDVGIKHSVSEHKSSISRLCIVIEFSFLY